MNPHGRRVTVLVADDNADDRALIEEALVWSCPTADVRHVGDGEELLEYLDRRGNYAHPTASPRPELILIDLNMPRVDGRDALRALKSDPERSQIPVVVMTTSTAAKDVEATHALGANTFVSKPDSYSSLVDDIGVLSRYWLALAALPTRRRSD